MFNLVHTTQRQHTIMHQPFELCVFCTCVRTTNVGLFVYTKHTWAAQLIPVGCEARGRTMSRRMCARVRLCNGIDLRACPTDGEWGIRNQVQVRVLVCLVRVTRVLRAHYARNTHEWTSNSMRESVNQNAVCGARCGKCKRLINKSMWTDQKPHYLVEDSPFGNWVIVCFGVCVCVSTYLW